MDCISPLSLRKEGSRSAKARLVVPCGKCVACLQKRRSDWTFRLLEEEKCSKGSVFLTLTYNDESYPGKACKRDVQLFIKKLRNNINGKLKYYLVSEKGSMGRYHYHGLLFNVDRKVDFEKIWAKGFISVGNIERASVHYVTGYMINKEDNNFALISKNLGRSYLDRAYEWHKKEKRFFVKNGNADTRLPRYYSEKIFNIMERNLHYADSIIEKDRKFNEELESSEKLSDNYFLVKQSIIENLKKRVVEKNKKLKL